MSMNVRFYLSYDIKITLQSLKSPFWRKKGTTYQVTYESMYMTTYQFFCQDSYPSRVGAISPSACLSPFVSSSTHVYTGHLCLVQQTELFLAEVKHKQRSTAIQCIRKTL